MRDMSDRWSRLRERFRLRRPFSDNSSSGTSSSLRFLRRRRPAPPTPPSNALHVDINPPTLSLPPASHHALRYRREALDDPVMLRSALVDMETDYGDFPGRDLSLLAVMNRFFDEYGTNATGSRAPRVMRVQNAYYIAGPRRSGNGGRTSLTAEMERQFRWSVRTSLHWGERAEQSTGPTWGEVGASESEIDQLPSIIVKKGETRSMRKVFADEGWKVAGDDQLDQTSLTGEEEEECPICLGGFEAGDEVVMLKCGHIFHGVGCVREWLREHARTCPTCRCDIAHEPNTLVR